MTPIWVLLLLFGYIQPQTILINEIMTKVTGKSQYLEIARNSADNELDLDGMSIVIAKTSSNRNNKKLEVSLAIDLSGYKLRTGQHFAVIGRHESEMEGNDLIAFEPSSPKIQLVNKQLTAYNWLDVEPTKYMIIFLVHSTSKKIFDDKVIWPYQYGHHSLKNMGDDLEHYLLSNFIDLLFVHGLSVTKTCKDVERLFVPEHLDEIHSILTTASSLDDLSISRCGLLFQKCLFKSFKSSARTPGIT